jgi:two-component system chemotaxis sensor kinase CheA
VRLPLTLAIINGFQVGVGKSVFVIPMDMVEECIEFRDSRAATGSTCAASPCPSCACASASAGTGAPARRQSIVVVRYGSRKAGLVVDSLLGEFQTVIKPLGKVFAGARFLSGSSILGSGDVALILDMAALLAGVEPSAMPRHDILNLTWRAIVLKNLKIGIRLGLGFGAILLLLLAIAMLASAAWKR